MRCYSGFPSTLHDIYRGLRPESHPDMQYAKTDLLIDRHITTWAIPGMICPGSGGVKLERL